MSTDSIVRQTQEDEVLNLAVALLANNLWSILPRTTVVDTYAPSS